MDTATQGKIEVRALMILVALACSPLAMLGITALANTNNPPPGEVCEDPRECGNTNDLAPLTLCAPNQAGAQCDGCPGATKIRFCVPNQQQTKCTFPPEEDQVAKNCGDPFKGICTQHTVLKVPTGFFYCKKDPNLGAGMATCSNFVDCTGQQ
jgi:hypothetical protein